MSETEKTRVSESLTAERIREIAGSQAEVQRLWNEQREREAGLAAPEPRSPEELVGEALLSAHRAAELVLENARQEASRLAAEAGRGASPILSEAHRTLEEAKALYEEAQATLEQARLQAEALLDAARSEREQLIANSVAAAEERRAELDSENRRLGQAIHDLRAEWVTRASEALARLDRIALMAGATGDPPALASTDAALDEGSGEPADDGHDVAADLQSRLPEGGAAAEPEAAADTQADEGTPGEGEYLDAAEAGTLEDQPVALPPTDPWDEPGYASEPPRSYD